jgi:serine/threonine protein kinase
LQNTLASTMMYQFNLKKETRKQQQQKKNRKRRSTIASGPPPTANLSLADFDFLQVLGTGTFGRVRLCMYKATRQYYCMKILRKQTIYRYKQMEHIKNEKNILKDLKHQGIVQL